MHRRAGASAAAQRAGAMAASAPLYYAEGLSCWPPYFRHEIYACHVTAADRGCRAFAQARDARGAFMFCPYAAACFHFRHIDAIDFHAAAILHCRDLPPRHADTFILRDAAATPRLVFEPSAIAGFRCRFDDADWLFDACFQITLYSYATPPLMSFLRHLF
jgi:hypothetical protein